MSHQRIRIATILTDLLLVNGGFALAYVIRYQWQWLRPITFLEPFSDYLGQLALLNILLIFTFIQVRVWRRKRGEFWVDELSRITYAVAAGIGLLSMIAFFVQPTPFSRLMYFWAFLAIVVLIGTARLLRRSLLAMLYQRGILADRVLVIGSGEVGRSLIRTLLARPDLGYQAIGYLHDGLSENNIGLGRIPNLGTFADLPRMLAERPHLHTVFIALPGEMHQQISQLLRLCQEHSVRAQVVPDLLQLSMNRVEFNNMAGIPTLGVRDVGISRFQQLTKRLLDLAIILLGGLPALLVMGMIALAIKLDSPGPVIYKAMRVGKNGRSFPM
ncbi:MAG: sugar transferase, partial [Anaerolineales bacterium]|nr:sugar transferase [Anaerolineales bacterium]